MSRTYVHSKVDKLRNCWKITSQTPWPHATPTIHMPATRLPLRRIPTATAMAPHKASSVPDHPTHRVCSRVACNRFQPCQRGDHGSPSANTQLVGITIQKKTKRIGACDRGPCHVWANRCASIEGDVDAAVTIIRATPTPNSTTAPLHRRVPCRRSRKLARITIRIIERADEGPRNRGSPQSPTLHHRR